MGCGCTRSTFTENATKVTSLARPVDQAKTRADSRISAGAGGDDPSSKKSYNIIVKKDEILVRFNRKGEVMDYYSRESSRPVHLSDISRIYASSKSLSTRTETWTPPTTVQSVSGNPPSIGLKLDYVYGYQCYASRQNLYYLNSEEVVYPCGALGVILHKGNNTQRFIGGGDIHRAKGHSDDIISLTVNLKKDLVATGEVGSNPLICIWRLTNLDQPICELEQGNGSRGVGILSFSADSKLLAAVDISSDQYIRIYDLKTQHVVHAEKGYPGHVYSLVFSGKGNNFCSVGISHVFFWTKHPSGFAREKGVYGTVGNECAMSTVQWFSTGTCVTGGHNGKLYLWENCHLTKVQQILSGSQEIHVLAVSNDFLVTGGQDSKLHVLDSSLKKLRVIDLSDWPRALDIYGTALVCSTRNGVISEILNGTQQVLMETHSEGEVWSLAQDPQNPNIMISTGDDNKIKVWDIGRKRCVSTYIIDVVPVQNTAHRSSLLPSSQQSRAISISPNGQVAVGHNDGHISIRTTKDLETVLYVMGESRTWIRCLVYSPTGDMLAAGDFDGKIFIFNAGRDYTLEHTFELYQSPVTSLDWSIDGERLKSCSQEGELHFFDVMLDAYLQDGEREMKDEVWATWTSAKGWPVRGVSLVPNDDLFVTCVASAHRNQVVAVGNSWGLIDLYAFPNPPQARSKSYKAHSLEVANLFWGLDDHILMSAGGHDLALMQWKVMES